ncbi:MAG: hypothetical protein U0930_04640, partial [Pirellulales bacterium]
SLMSTSTVVLALASGCDSDAAKKMEDKAATMAKEAAAEVSSGGADLLGKATEALSGVEGGSEMLKQSTELFGKLTSTLSGVKDADTATAASTEISKLAEGFSGMSEMFGKMPDAAKSAVSGVFKNSIDQLKPILEKVMAIPGVEAILKPTIETLMSKLEGFKA